MSYNPKIHKRRSIRFKGYDYSSAGLYFVTICLQDRARLLGEIQNGKMILNSAGLMVEKWWFKLENKFPDKKCHAMVVMPDHFHCILETVEMIRGEQSGITNGGEQVKITARGEHLGSPLAAAIQWFKTMSTNEYIRGVKQYGWTKFNRKLWQRNYWEHIIRNEQAYERISRYIENNPSKWKG